MLRASFSLTVLFLFSNIEIAHTKNTETRVITAQASTYQIEHSSRDFRAFLCNSSYFKTKQLELVLPISNPSVLETEPKGQIELEIRLSYIVKTALKHLNR